MRLDFGIPVTCELAIAGRVADIVLDPASRRVTHVVLLAEDGVARLVPIQLFRPSVGRDELTLTCAVDELADFAPIRHSAYLSLEETPEAGDEEAVGIEEMMTVPYLDGAQMGDYIGEIEPNVMLTYDLIPKGEAELRETSGVVSADGHTCGHATGLDIEQGQLTNLVLERGHLWWKRSVNVPVESIEAIDNDLVTLKLAKAEVGAMASGKARR